MRYALITAIVLCGVACLRPAPEPAPVRVADGQVRMGTVLEISLYARSRASGLRTLERLFRRAAELEAVFSHFDPTSDLSALNRGAETGPSRLRPVHPDLARILARSVGLSRRTGGAFDVTIGPLVELWTEAARTGRLPTRRALAETRGRVGSEQLRVEEEGSRAAIAAGTRVNLSAVAKGHALDLLVGMLADAPVSGALLDFGGSSLHAVGAPPGHDGWRVLLRGASDDFAGVVVLRDRALSVSNAVGQSSWIAGRRYGHVIDPRTGQPLESERLAAVVATSGALAEALSTAFLILDEGERARALRATPRAESLVLDSDGGASASGGWIAATAFAPLRPS